jgi:hypothetical protein
MMTIDPRLADRRRQVAEDRARRNVNRILRLLAVVGVVGGLVWLFLSPTLSVATVDVTGVHSSDTMEVLVEHKVTLGRPLILVRTGAVRDDLLADPWVKEAAVALDWPRRVVVDITERTPTAWVETAGGWARRAIDGVALPGASEPDDSMGRVSLVSVADEKAATSKWVLGALEFIDMLPVALGSEAVLEERSGELWAVVGGFEVRLGRPAAMSDKALSLATLLQEPLEAGSTINMIAPTNPAVVPPGGVQDPDSSSG